MNGVLLALTLAMFGAILALAPADGAPAILLALPLSALAGLAIFKFETDRRFLLRLFVSALLVRILVGTLIYLFHWQTFFGGDARTYDFFGYALLRTWEGSKDYEIAVNMFTGGGSS